MRKLTTIVLGLLLLVLLVTQIQIIFEKRQIEDRIIRIKKGDNAKIIAERLEKADIINSSFYLVAYLIITKQDNKLTYGAYRFDGKYNIPDVVENIVNNKIILKSLTIPEGLFIEEVGNLISKKEFGKKDTFTAICRDSSKFKEFLSPAFPFKNLKSLEGFLYPETYFFPKNASIKAIIRKMTDEFTEKYSTLSRYQTKLLNEYEVIKLASIVEKEAKKREEKPKIASVYLNRVKKDMKLQADPTISYLLKKRGKFREKVYYKDLEIDSPYNTYKYKGLPPTPICNPSLESIEAVLYPDSTEYFFFFAKDSGYHDFSKTYREHSRKLRKFRNGS